MLTGALCFDPVGDRVAFVAKSGGHDALFVRNLQDRGGAPLQIKSNGLAGPAWNPARTRSCSRRRSTARPTCSLVDLKDGSRRALTNDAADQLTPRFFPDGKRVAFVYYPEVTIPVPSDFTTGENKRTRRDRLSVAEQRAPRRDYDIWEFDMVTRTSAPLVESPGDDTEPLHHVGQQDHHLCVRRVGCEQPAHRQRRDARSTIAAPTCWAACSRPASMKRRGALRFRPSSRAAGTSTCPTI